MKEIINGKMYKTDTAEVIAEKDLYSYNNNYAGTRKMMITKKGNLFTAQFANGQDFNIRSFISLDINVDGMEIINEELAKKYNLYEDA